MSCIQNLESSNLFDDCRVTWDYKEICDLKDLKRLPKDPNADPDYTPKKCEFVLTKDLSTKRPKGYKRKRRPFNIDDFNKYRNVFNILTQKNDSPTKDMPDSLQSRLNDKSQISSKCEKTSDNDDSWSIFDKSGSGEVFPATPASNSQSNEKENAPDELDDSLCCSLLEVFAEEEDTEPTSSQKLPPFVYKTPPRKQRPTNQSKSSVPLKSSSKMASVNSNKFESDLSESEIESLVKAAEVLEKQTDDLPHSSSVSNFNQSSNSINQQPHRCSAAEIERKRLAAQKRKRVRKSSRRLNYR